MFLQLLFLTIILLLWKIYSNFRKKYQYWEKKGVKVIKPIFPFGNILPLLTKRTGITPCLNDWYNTMDEKVIGLYALDEPILLIRDPDLIKSILVKDFNYFTDRGVYIDKREPTAGHLWKLPGEKWRPLRTKMTSCFSVNKLKMMFSNLLKVGNEMEKNLNLKCEKDESINFEELCQMFTVDVIATSIFGVEINSFIEKHNHYLLMEKELTKSESRIRMIKAALQIIVPNFFELFNFIKFETVNQKALSFVHEMVKNVIEYREKTSTVKNDMMQLLIQLKNYGKIEDEKSEDDKNDFCLTMNEVTAQAYTYFFVGSETASSALLALVYECALNENIQRKLQCDIDRALNLHNGNVTYESILEMKYLDMVKAETLRKYPILGFLQRKAVKNYTIPNLNVEIEKGTRLYFSIQGLHHDPNHYPDPNKFDPERFSSENEGKIHSYAYLPYGEGPRNCIGKRLAHFMVAVGAIYIFKNFNVHICDKTDIPFNINPLAYTVKPINPIYLKISKRSNSNMNMKKDTFYT